MPPLSLVDGRLPLGRWSATELDVEAAFVTGWPDRRRQIWEDWLGLKEAVQEAVGVLPAAWLGGSFFTDKPEPGDIDSVFVIEAAKLLAAKISPTKAQILQVVADNQVKDTFGLKVDSFILEWVPRPGTVKADWATPYRDQRGYWDDLWSRERSRDPRRESVPTRGYVEVIIDGYI